MHIYKWTHIASGKCYIGQSIQNPNQRRLEHTNDSKYTKKTYHFHNALRKYGVDAFTWEVIDTAMSIEELNLLEEKFVAQYDSINNGYNIRQPGNNKKHNPESIKRMSEAQKAAHARRRAQNGGIETTKPHKKHKSGWEHPRKGKENKKWDHKGMMGWKLIDGVRIWYNKEASA